MIVNTLVRAAKHAGIHPKDPALASFFRAPLTKAGVPVNEDTALTLGSVWACARVLAEGVAQLPLPILSTDGNGETSKAKDHVSYNTIHTRPNQSMSSYIFREAMQGQAALNGNGIAIIKRTASGSGVELHPFQTRNVRMDEDHAGNIIYEFTENNQPNRFKPESEVLHIKGFTPDGLWGYSPVRLMREMIGLGLATERFGASVFGTKAMPGGHYEVPWVMDDDEFANFKRKAAGFSGMDGWNETMILEKGIKFAPAMMTPEDSQFLLTRKQNPKDIARIWRVPPHMIGVLDDATYSNIEQESLNFVIYTLMPWLVNWEQELNWKLFAPSQRDRFFVEFNVDGLLRGDAKARAEANKTRFMHGALNLDEWRAQDNLNPLPDDQGQRHFVPVNLTPLDKIDDEPAEPVLPVLPQDEPEPDDDGESEDQDSEEDDDSRSMIAKANELIWESAVDQLLTKEAKSIRRAAKGSATDAEVKDWLEEFFDDHRGAVIHMLGPVLRSFGGEPAVAYTEQFASRYAAVGSSELTRVAWDSSDPWGSVRDGLENWTNKRRRELLGVEYGEAVATLTENGHGGTNN